MSFLLVVKAWWGDEKGDTSAVHAATTTSCAWHNHHKWRRHWCLTASQIGALQAHLQNEKGIRCWRAGSVPGLLMLQTSWASFFAECFRRMCRSLLPVKTKYYGNFEDNAISLVITGFASRHLVEGMLDFEGNLLLEDELERQDRECPSWEHLIPNASGNVDQQLTMLVKVSCLIDALKLGRSYEFVPKILGRIRADRQLNPNFWFLVWWWGPS